MMWKNHLYGVLLFAGLSVTPATGSPLGQINLRLKGNVVDYTCVVQASDNDSVIPLGRWSIKQLIAEGSTTMQIPFTLRLTGCPPGSASLTFTGSSPAGHNQLLALNDASTAGGVAIELRDRDRTRLPLQQASQPVSVDANGDATLQFFANYISTGRTATAGSANADATFVINYE